MLAICQPAAAVFNLNLRLWIERLDVSGRFHVRIFFLKSACITIIHKSTLKRWKKCYFATYFSWAKQVKNMQIKMSKTKGKFCQDKFLKFEHLDWLMANNKTNFAISQSKCSIWEIGFLQNRLRDDSNP